MIGVIRVETREDGSESFRDAALNSLSIASDLVIEWAIVDCIKGLLSGEEYSEIEEYLNGFGFSPEDVEELPWKHESDLITYEIKVL